MVRTLRAKRSTSLGTVQRVADPLGYGVKSVRSCVGQAGNVDAVKAGLTTDERVRVRDLEQKVRELECANYTLKRASPFLRREARPPTHDLGASILTTRTMLLLSVVTGSIASAG